MENTYNMDKMDRTFIEEYIEDRKARIKGYKREIMRTNSLVRHERSKITTMLALLNSWKIVNPEISRSLLFFTTSSRGGFLKVVVKEFLKSSEIPSIGNTKKQQPIRKNRKGKSYARVPINLPVIPYADVYKDECPYCNGRCQPVIQKVTRIAKNKWQVCNYIFCTICGMDHCLDIGEENNKP